MEQILQSLRNLQADCLKKNDNYNNSNIHNGHC